MPLAALLALTLLAAAPAEAAPAQAAPEPAAASSPPAQTVIDADADADDDNDIPANAPKDDYGFVGWCYGALDEYLSIYEQVKPDLKDIDKLFGSPVVEEEPYSQDIAEDRKALKRFGLALHAAQVASLRPIGDQGSDAIQGGRAMWSLAKMQPHRRLADAWLFWGLPPRCDRAAKRLTTRAALMGQAVRSDAAGTPKP